MNLDNNQKQKITTWITEGLKVSEIQVRIEKELGIRMTYMEVKFLLDDLRLIPKDIVTQPTSTTIVSSAKPNEAETEGNDSPGGGDTEQPVEDLPEDLGGTGSVSVSVDEITHPGSMVSGNVTFSDGNTAKWYIDQYGRLGLAPAIKGYRPSPGDVQEFQASLQAQLARMGF